MPGKIWLCNKSNPKSLWTLVNYCCTSHAIQFSTKNTHLFINYTVTSRQLFLIIACINQDLLLPLCFIKQELFTPLQWQQFFVFFCFYSTNHIPPWLQATTEWNIVISFDNTAEVPSIPITERPDQVDHKCFNVKTESNWKMASSCLIIRADKAPGPGSLHASFSLWELQVEALSTGKNNPFSHTPGS